MHRQAASHFHNIAFNPQYIEEYVPMQPLNPRVFDLFCEDGWCYWADLMFRRNFWEWRDEPCRVVMLRIRLDGFTFSKSQRRTLRRNADLNVYRRSIRITERHETLFEKHAERFHHNRPSTIYGFFSPWSSIMPCNGMQYDVYARDQLVATSFFHLGKRSMSGNYCIFDPAETTRSLGTYTMLREIDAARHMGLQYYYPGFVYDIPSEFDYKLNFNNLEYFDWWGNWYPLERKVPGEWKRSHLFT
jgi:arginine-tRNA-protein transferase